jgi:hypothetical protein
MTQDVVEFIMRLITGYTSISGCGKLFYMRLVLLAQCSSRKDKRILHREVALLI